MNWEVRTGLPPCGAITNLIGRSNRRIETTLSIGLDEYREILKLKNEGVPLGQIAKKYKTTRDIINGILHNGKNKIEM